MHDRLRRSSTTVRPVRVECFVRCTLSEVSAECRKVSCSATLPTISEATMHASTKDFLRGEECVVLYLSAVDRDTGAPVTTRKSDKKMC